jgi:hypothetical protein
MLSRTMILLLVLFSLPLSVNAEDEKRLPSVREMANARQDVWGEAAIRQPGGPSYEFFKDLLLPLRYVNTAFRHYPIVLSAPGARIKARWVSNGSAVNARANQKPMWREVGFPVHFHLGDRAEVFGEDLERLNGPGYVEGYLPIVRSAYKQAETTYEQEAFAPVSGALAEQGAVAVRFTVRGTAGSIQARLPLEGALTAAEGSVRDCEGRGLVLFDAGWHWDSDKKELRVRLQPGQTAVLLILTQSLLPPVPPFDGSSYEKERKACSECWQTLLGRGMKLEVPEPIVNNAWRSLVVGQFLIAVGDRMLYSAGNAYDHLYEAECGDAVRSLLLYGFAREARSMIGPLLAFQRHATRFHVAGHKLQLLAHYYWLTRDADAVRSLEQAWKPTVDLILRQRQKSNGLLPPDRYPGDIKQEVISLSSNANCWHGLRDMAAVLADLEERGEARRLAQEAREFREAILKAVVRSERRDSRPPFIPIALLSDEQPYETLTATRKGSYYDLMAPYVLGSGVFAPGSERETWMIDYLRQHGGLAMGMIRSTPHQGQFNNEPGVNVLYGLRYALTLLRRDDREHVLTGFYGQLAQGMTRDTFIGAEGTRFLHGDRLGRSMYLPPNSASNAMFLTMLRYLLIQDWDDDEGKPETLRLLYAVPGRWLKNGAVINVEGAPTRFGAISFHVESRLSRNEVLMRIDSPSRRPARWFVRLPLPAGWKVSAASVGDTAVPLGDGSAVDLSARSGQFTIRFRVKQVEIREK